MPSLLSRKSPYAKQTKGKRICGSPWFVMFLFGMEGFMIQTVSSINSYANPLYATYLGATQEQLGLISSVPAMVSLFLLLPAGLAAGLLPSSRAIPVLLSFFMSAMYALYALIPQLSSRPMMWYFLFLGMTAGLLNTYNAQWQSFFADAVAESDRNDVYTFRNRLSYPVTIAVPIACGAVVSRVADAADKLIRFRLIYLLCAALLVLQGIVLLRIPLGRRSPSRDHLPLLHEIPDALSEMLHSKSFMGFFASILLFYASWYLDLSCWYLAQTRYGGMKEMHLSCFSALFSLSQFLTLNLFSRINRRRSVHFTILLGIAGLMFCPLAVIVSAQIQGGLRPWVFMIIGVLFNTTPVCIPLCVVQMLLHAIPQKHRSLNISLYTMATCSLQMIMPYIGSRIYQGLGADQRAMVLFYSIVMAARAAVLLLFICRYKRICPVQSHGI